MRIGMILLGTLALVAAGVLTASVGARVERHVALEPNQIGFYRNPSPGRWALWAVNTDGRNNERRLISRLNGADSHTPSPNFPQLAYARRFWIHLMRPDGTRKRRIIGPGIPAYTSARLSSPTWSPDGRTVAFDASCGSDESVDPTTHGIYRAEINGGKPRALIPCVSGNAGGGSPKWSSTNWIAYHRIPYTHFVSSIWAMRPDGSQNHLILDKATGRLSWSPDGQQLAYDSGDGTWVVNADGSNDHRLIEGCTNPDWATTGEILCDGNVNGQSGAFVIRPNGTGLRLLHARRPGTGERDYFWMRARSR